MSITFYDHKKIAECEARENYTFDRRGECRKKCQEDDGPYIIDAGGKCVINTRIKESPNFLSGLFPTVTHPDLEISAMRCLNGCFVLKGRVELYFRVKNWPYEPLSPLIISLINHGDGEVFPFQYHSLEELGEINFKNERFSMDSFGGGGMIFHGGILRYGYGEITLHEAPLFMRRLHDYVSEVFIRDK